MSYFINAIMVDTSSQALLKTKQASTVQQFVNPRVRIMSQEILSDLHLSRVYCVQG